jgi:hypothetical protein
MRASGAWQCVQGAARIAGVAVHDRRFSPLRITRAERIVDRHEPAVIRLAA